MNMKKSFSPKERVLTSLNWQEPDRVPVQIYMVPEIEKKLKDFFGGRDLMEVFEIDFRYVGAPKKPELQSLKAPVVLILILQPLRLLHQKEQLTQNMSNFPWRK